MVKFVMAVAAVWVLGLAGAAQASSVLIDDFSGGVGSWDTSLSNLASAVTVTPDGRLQLTASNSYTWNGEGWDLDPASNPYFWIARTMTVPNGTDSLTFHAAANFAGAAPGVWIPPYVQATVTYSILPGFDPTSIAGFGVSGAGDSMVIAPSGGAITVFESILTNDGTVTRDIPLYGIDTTQEFTYGFIVACDPSYPVEPGAQRGDRLSTATTAYFDDVALSTAAVPEPLTILGVSLGIAGLGRYLRRRLA